jgi:hypothetical protein
MKLIIYRIRVSTGKYREQDSSGSIVSADGLDDRGSIPGRGERIFPLASVSTSDPRPTQPPVQWVRGGGSFIRSQSAARA